MSQSLLQDVFGVQKRIADEKDSASLLECLSFLQRLDMSPSILAKSNISRTIGSLRRHDSDVVVQAASSLLGQWKMLASESTNIEPPAHLRVDIFYSKSKDNDDLGINIPNWRKILSNFYPVPDSSPGLVLTGSGQARTYRTVEHAFQASKYLLCCDSPNREATAARFEIGGQIVSSLDAKKAGGRSGMAKFGCTLDTAAWSQHGDVVMQEALRARWGVDPTFRDVLSATKGILLVHFERSGKKSYWGGTVKAGPTGDAGGGGGGSGGEVYQGRNRLGEMLMELRDMELQEPMPIATNS